MCSSKYEVVYTDNLPILFGGFCVFPNMVGRMLRKSCVIKIRPKYINDLGILRHEIKHVEQFNRYWYYALAYRVSKYFRYRMELEAYSEQIDEYMYTNISQCEWIIEALLNKYNFGITKCVIISDVSRLLCKNEVVDV